MIICSDVDGVILNYIQGFIDFTRDENIDYQYNPENYGVITGVENAENLRKRFHARITCVNSSIMKEHWKC